MQCAVSESVLSNQWESFWNSFLNLEEVVWEKRLRKGNKLKFLYQGEDWIKEDGNIMELGDVSFHSGKSFLFFWTIGMKQKSLTGFLITMEFIHWEKCFYVVFFFFSFFSFSFGHRKVFKGERGERKEKRVHRYEKSIVITLDKLIHPFFEWAGTWKGTLENPRDPKH